MGKVFGCTTPWEYSLNALGLPAGNVNSNLLLRRQSRAWLQGLPPSNNQENSATWTFFPPCPLPWLCSCCRSFTQGPTARTSRAFMPESDDRHLLYWSQGKNTALNITVVNPLKEANAKMSKYEDKCVAEDIACCGHLWRLAWNCSSCRLYSKSWHQGWPAPQVDSVTWSL